MRDPKSWYRSARETIFRIMEEEPPEDDATAQAQWRLVREMILRQTFGGSTADPDLAIAVLEMHDEEVKRRVPAERLLVYEVAEGWEPLCRFLGVRVPDEPFPRVNTTEEFVQRLETRRAGGGSPVLNLRR